MSPRFVPISPFSSDLFRFAFLVCGNTPICSDLLRFVPMCFQNKSEQIRETPFCRPLLQIPDLGNGCAAVSCFSPSIAGRTLTCAGRPATCRQRIVTWVMLPFVSHIFAQGPLPEDALDSCLDTTLAFEGASTGFYRYCAPDTSAPVVVINESPKFTESHFACDLHVGSAGH